MNQFLVLILTILFSCSSIAGDGALSILDKKGRVSGLFVTQYIALVEPYIREYPPKFEGEEHKKRIVSSTNNVINELVGIDFGKIKDVDLLVDIAHIFSMGHNLDLGTASASKTIFEHALSVDSSNARANYLFGMFLVSTKKYLFESEKYLKKALELGKTEAKYSLALLQIQKGHADVGLKMLEEYIAEYPENSRAKKVIESLKRGELKFRATSSG